MTIVRRLAIAALLLLVAAPMSHAQSLFRDAGPGTSLFIDHKARGVNDIVTILIVEQSSSSRTADTKTSKDQTRTAGVSQFPTMFDGLARVFVKPLVKDWIGWKTPSQFAQQDLNLSMQSNGEHEGKGNIDRSDKVTGQLPARVVKVLDNGNLVVEGRRVVVVNDEDQIMTISGVVRPEDITSTNTVLSSQIAEAEIAMTGRGVLAEAQRPGIIYRFLDWLHIF